MSPSPGNRWKRPVQKEELEIRDLFSSSQPDAYYVCYEMQKSFIRCKFRKDHFLYTDNKYCSTYLATFKRIKSSSKAGSKDVLFFVASILVPSSSHRKRSKQLLRSIDRINCTRRCWAWSSRRALIICVYLQDSISVSKPNSIRKLTNSRSPFPSLKSERKIA